MAVRSGLSVPAAAKTAEIACRRRNAVHAGHRVRRQQEGLRRLACQRQPPAPKRAATRGGRAETGQPSMDHIQGGDGTIYGVQGIGPGLHNLYKADHAHRGGRHSLDVRFERWVEVRDRWRSSNVSDRLAWPRRAFSTAPDGTAAFSTIRSWTARNIWPFFDTGSERFSVLTAGATNFLYGIGQVHTSGLVPSSCSEGRLHRRCRQRRRRARRLGRPRIVEKAAVAFCARSTTLSRTTYSWIATSRHFS